MRERQNPPYLRDWSWLAVAFGCGVILRVVVAAYSGLSNDAAAFYLPGARALFTHGVTYWDGLSSAVPPLFPTLVALLAHVVGDCERAALTMSIVSGAAMIFPVYGIARWQFPGRLALHRWSLLIVMLQRSSLEGSGDAKGDACYAFCFATTVWLGLGLWRRPGPIAAYGRALAFGAFLGAAYLIRPEALGLAPLLAIAVLYETWRRSRARAASGAYFRAAVGAGLLAIAALAPSLIWQVAFVHAKIGVYTLSPKAGVLQDYEKDGKDDAVLGRLNSARTMTMQEERLNSSATYQSFSPLQQFLENPRGMAKSYAKNLGKFIEYFPWAMGVVPMLLLLAGIWRCARRAAPGGVAATIATYTFYAVAFAIFYVSRRFWLALLPMAVPMAAGGALWLSQCCYSRWRVRRRWVAVALTLALLPEALHSTLKSQNRWFSSPEAALGERLRDRAGVDQNIVSQKGLVTYYAGGRHLPLPAEPLPAILDYMKNRDARFLVLDRYRRERDSRSKEREQRRLDFLASVAAEPTLIEIDRESHSAADLVVYELRRVD
ncbi:MAG: glycosyltransferase family 39 protein [Planctomycetota bacterium]